MHVAGDYPFEVPMEDVPEPPPDWKDDLSDCDDSDDSDVESVFSSVAEQREAEQLAAWRTRKREELLEDMICDEEPDWNKPALLADPVASDLIHGLLCKDPKSRLSAAEALEHRCNSTRRCCYVSIDAHATC
jgi:serine/threonine protein kinase